MPRPVPTDLVECAPNEQHGALSEIISFLVLFFTHAIKTLAPISVSSGLQNQEGSEAGLVFSGRPY